MSSDGHKVNRKTATVCVCTIPSFSIRNSAFCIRAFTLVELLVVLTLLSLVAGMSVVHWEGFSKKAKLMSAARQAIDWTAIARHEAKLTGRPQLITYQHDRMTLHRPVLSGTRWEWDPGRFVVFPAGVTLRRLLTPNVPADQSEHSTSVRVDPAGRARSHALVMGCGSAEVTVRFSSSEEPLYEIVERPLQARTLDVLTIELESRRAAH